MMDKQGKLVKFPGLVTAQERTQESLEKLDAIKELVATGDVKAMIVICISGGDVTPLIVKDFREEAGLVEISKMSMSLDVMKKSVLDEVGLPGCCDCGECEGDDGQGEN